MVKRILLVTVHQLLPAQQTELWRIFGEDVEIVRFKSGGRFEDTAELVQFFSQRLFDALVMIAPENAVAAVREQGIAVTSPLMKLMPPGTVFNPRTDIKTARGRLTRFLGFGWWEVKRTWHPL